MRLRSNRSDNWSDWNVSLTFNFKVSFFSSSSLFRIWTQLLQAAKRPSARCPAKFPQLIHKLIFKMISWKATHDAEENNKGSRTINVFYAWRIEKYLDDATLSRFEVNKMTTIKFYDIDVALNGKGGELNSSLTRLEYTSSFMAILLKSFYFQKKLSSSLS